MVNGEKLGVRLMQFDLIGASPYSLPLTPHRFP